MWGSQMKDNVHLTGTSHTVTWCCLTITKEVGSILGWKSLLWRRMLFCLVFLTEDMRI